jgi:EF hand
VLEQETHFDSVEILGQFAEFQSLAEDGYISRATFDRCLGTVGTKPNIIIDRMFAFYDQDQDGVISFSEMVWGLSVLNRGTLDERMLSMM